MRLGRTHLLWKIFMFLQPYSLPRRFTPLTGHTPLPTQLQHPCANGTLKPLYYSFPKQKTQATLLACLSQSISSTEPNNWFQHPESFLYISEHGENEDKKSNRRPTHAGFLASSLCSCYAAIAFLQRTLAFLLTNILSFKEIQHV